MKLVAGEPVNTGACAVEPTNGVIRYPVIGPPPFEAGAVHVSETARSSGLPVEVRAPAVVAPDTPRAASDTVQVQRRAAAGRVRFVLDLNLDPDARAGRVIAGEDLGAPVLPIRIEDEPVARTVVVQRPHVEGRGGVTRLRDGCDA